MVHNVHTTLTILHLVQLADEHLAQIEHEQGHNSIDHQNASDMQATSGLEQLEG